MIKKILGLAIAVLILSGMMGIGTWAYFSDFEKSTGNVLAAGTLDLKTNDADGVSQTVFMTNMSPGSIAGPEYVILRNAGSIDASSIEFVFSYIENDLAGNPINMSANETAGQMEVTTLSYDGNSLLGSITDANSNGYIDVYDLVNDTFTGYSGINAYSYKEFAIALRLKSDTGSEYQGDGIEITMAFLLQQ